MGTSVQWYAVAEDKSQCSRMPGQRSSLKKHATRSQQRRLGLETGLKRNQVRRRNSSRDYALRVTFGNGIFLRIAVQKKVNLQSQA